MKRALANVLFLAAVGTSAACGMHHKSFVRVDDVALGRVVVYRNGVAYYERRASVHGGKLTIVVPRDRVDDFLKSLTVADAKTGDPLPVSFPRQQGDYGNFVEMSLQVPAQDADVVLTYVTESPAWKPSYRLVVDEKKHSVLLQAWAIVDNTSGEDWKNVILGVGSSSALSFKYDLWTVHNVQRETLASQDSFAVAPPTAQSTYTQTAQGQEQVVAQLDDSEIRRPPGHPDYVDQPAQPAPAAAGGAGTAVPATAEAPPEADYENAGETITTTDAGGSGSYKRKHYDTAKKHRGHGKAGKEPVKDDGDRLAIGGAPEGSETAPPPPPRDTNATSGDAKLQQLAQQLRSNNQNIVIEGYGDANDPNAEQTSNDRANLVRNQLIDAGVPPAQVRVENKGVVAGHGPGVQVVADTTPAATPADQADAPPVGESNFVSSKPMSVDKGTSVMASMLEKETHGELAYLYDPESTRGNDKFAFRSVRIENPTDSTLEPGPVTVYGQKRVIGEGLTEPIPPHASVVIPFALDRQVVVEHEDSTDNQVSKLVTLQRGILTAEVQHIRKTHLTITSRLRSDTVVYVRHTVEKGWTLTEAPKTFEKIADAHLFAIPVEAGKTVTVDIAEATPMVRTLDLSADPSLEMMNVFVQSDTPSPELKQQLKDLLAIHKDMVDGKEKIDGLRRHLADYRVRMDELTAQILSLKKVKSAGDLMKHLQDKLKEMSEDVQKATIAVVDTDEAIMMAKVKFQDALAELHLDDALSPTPDGALGLGSDKPADGTSTAH